MKKKLFFTAFALALFAGCSDNDYVGDHASLNAVTGNGAISFGFDVPTPTRAAGAAAATALGNQFIVYGEKSETDDGAAPVTDGSTVHQLVFKNYVVKYTGNSAYTTTSNTKDWEYVGLTQSYGTNVTPQASETQTIKYWDYSATNYVFTAVSALESQLTSGDVKVTKITSKTDGNMVYDKGYTVVLTASADPTKLYFSDRQVISQGSGTNRDAVNAYGGNVTFTFRNAASQIRVGMYETIPGYGVKIKKFYYEDAAAPTFGTMTTEATSNFTANVPNLSTSSAATLNVTYYNEGTRLNQPKIGVTGTPANYITLTGSGLAADVTLATSANAPTYDNSGNFTTVFPQESNDKSLKLKIDYQLFNTTTGETINVNGATAEIPANYLQWLPNYKYTYFFKISDNTNGSTGQGVVGLYPITFDALEIVAEDGTAEYITTVSEPSITTFGVNSSTGKYVAGGNEYAAGSDVYATVMDASALATLDANNFSIYDVTTSDATNFPVTEASVAEALIEGPTWTKAQADNKKITCAAGPTLTFQNTVPAEDGTTITLDASNNKAAKFTTAATKKYALVYQKTAAIYTVDGGHTYADADAFAAAGTLYTNSDCTIKAASWTDGSTTYYKRTAVSNKGVYAVKIVTVP